MKIRIARPTNDIKGLLPFYVDGIGLEVLGSFDDHDGFDGIMLGNKECPWHFEFTTKTGHFVERCNSKDNLLVFYLPQRSDWEACIKRMTESGFMPVESFNPYWDKNGKTFEDPDGYRVVFQNSSWN